MLCFMLTEVATSMDDYMDELKCIRYDYEIKFQWNTQWLRNLYSFSAKI